MATTGDVQLTILDGGGAVVVPSATVQVVIGTCSSGTVGQVVATRNINTLIAVFGYGPLVEAAAIIIAAGGTVICIKAASNTAGAQTAVTATATGTSVVTVTGAALDSYLVKVLVVGGGTIAAAGIRFQVSLDAGRNYGPVLSLGTANTYAIPNTGLTLAFGAGTLVVGDLYKFSTTEPLWNTAGIQACLNSLQLSQYAIVGWGSMHIVGATAAADAATMQGYLNTYATGRIYTRAMVNTRDSLIPVAYGGAGETEATWMSSLVTAFGTNDTKRICVSAGHYNMPSQIPNPVAGAPRYRRPLSWALAARQVAIQPQRHAGRVKDGSLQNIVVDATMDPGDGFVYHDERMNPGFDDARFSSATTRIKLPGFYIKNPKLMSAQGSVFTLLPLGNVMDIACGIVTEIGQTDINEDIRLNKIGGTIFENEAKAIESRFNRAIEDNMVAKNMLSDKAVSVDRTNNIASTSVVLVNVTIFARGYVLEEDITIGFGAAATGT